MPGSPHKATLRAFCWVFDLSAEQSDGGAGRGPSSFAPSCLIHALPLGGLGYGRVHEVLGLGGSLLKGISAFSHICTDTLLVEGSYRCKLNVERFL